MASEEMKRAIAQAKCWIAEDRLPKRRQPKPQPEGEPRPADQLEASGGRELADQGTGGTKSGG